MTCNEIFQKTGEHNPWKRVIEIGIWCRGHNNSFCLPLELILDSLTRVIDTSDWRRPRSRTMMYVFSLSMLFSVFLPHCASVPPVHSSTFHKRHGWIIEVAGRGECGLKWKRPSSMTHCLSPRVDLHDCLSFLFVHSSLCPSAKRHLVCPCVTYLLGWYASVNHLAAVLPFVISIFAVFSIKKMHSMI